VLSNFGGRREDMMSKEMTPNREISKKYGQVNLESDIESADPHRLVAMLLDGALIRIAKAKVEIKQGQVEEKITHLTQAVAIVDSLRASLNFEIDNTLVQNLEALYDYMTSQLVVANSQDDIEALDEVAHLLKEVSDAWSGIRPEVSGVSKKQPAVEFEEDAPRTAFTASV